MMLDADCLLEARLENVERLANALGLRLPPNRGNRVAYNRKLVRLILKHLEQERYAGARGRYYDQGYSA
jgi:hypothetical protein